MRILSCEINKVPVKTILDTATNCNILGRGLIDVLGLEINTSHKEEAKLLISFPSEKSSDNLTIEDSMTILGMVHKINLSFWSKDNKWKQVEVNDILVHNKPEFAHVLLLGSPWIQANISEINFSNHTLTLLDGTNILLDIPRELPPPKQISLPVKKYYKMVKYYITALGVNNNEIYLKEQFLRGLSPENQIEARRCGLELPLDKLVEKLRYEINNRDYWENFVFRIKNNLTSHQQIGNDPNYRNFKVQLALYKENCASLIIQQTYHLWKKQINSAKIIQHALIKWLYRPGGTLMKQAKDRYYCEAMTQRVYQNANKLHH
ncbi:1117_t:CDS:2 [Acaulospora morrowiae]|uniref:1117_t:CDS:1 n=1 Tax=Acaulospora morrowiae TaxID=94023 RepID=A0A9N8ZVM1_9GLOM|nr:1117_t:CDS:2 [Acaulospora morrowiae]